MQRTEPAHKLLIIIALMLAIALTALDATIVSTVMPTIAGKLGGLSQFSWVFSVYLLTSTVTVPLYGKLADIYGRKPVLLFGCGAFIAGSALCGAAGSMEALILFRAVQGLGAGAVQPVTMTIIGDSFSIQERAKLQGLFSSVWGVTALAGPAVGGLITDGLSWRWAFLINIPLGLACIVFLWRFFQEQPEKHSHVLDYWGTLLLTGSVIALLLGLLQGVDRYGWSGGPTLALFGTAALLLALFLAQERKAAEPVLPLWLFRNKVIAVSCLAVFAGGGLMFGVSSYVPLFAQGVRGGSAIDAGLIVLPMSISWPLGSILGGRIILLRGYYLSALIGGALLILGTASLLALSRDSSVAISIFAVTVIGIGMGLTTSALMISVQNAVEWRYRGVATASTQFFRTIGGAIMVAIMGATLNSGMTSRLAGVEGIPAGATADTLLDPAQRGALGAEALAAMQRALSGSLHEVYFLVLASALVLFSIVLFFPRGRVQDLERTAAAEAAARARAEEVAPSSRRGMERA
jgi:EmrB/QacA subfamily drug resistance transporter